MAAHLGDHENEKVPQFFADEGKIFLFNFAQIFGGIDEGQKSRFFILHELGMPDPCGLKMGIISDFHDQMDIPAVTLGGFKSSYF